MRARGGGRVGAQGGGGVRAQGDQGTRWEGPIGGEHPTGGGGDGGTAPKVLSNPQATTLSCAVKIYRKSDSN